MATIKDSALKKFPKMYTFQTLQKIPTKLDDEPDYLICMA